MNSLRIGMVGVMVDHFGPQDADGFLHLFEGWIIFIACAGLLAAEMYVLARFVSGKQFFDVFLSAKAAPLPDARSTSRAAVSAHSRAPLARLSCCCCARPAVAGAVRVARGKKSIPDRKLFVVVSGHAR